MAERGPEKVLDRPIVARVAGDRDAGFYAPRPGHGDPIGPGGARLEAYRWSGLTGGTATRTLSVVLLLPFMLSNGAIWMLPTAGPSGALPRALCRLLAATITAMYVLSLASFSLDLLAWQCAGYPRCLEGRRIISWLGGIPPAQRLAILAALPITAIALVWRLGAWTLRLPEDAATTPEGVGAQRPNTPAYWDTRILRQRLRSVHAVVALCTLDAVLVLPVETHDARLHGHALLAAVVGVLVAALALLCLPAFERRGRERWFRATLRSLRWAAIVLTGLSVAYLAAPRPYWAARGPLPHFGEVVSGLFVGQVVLLVVLAVFVRVQARRPPDARLLIGGMGAPVLITIAIAIGLAYSSALSYLVAEYLDRGSNPTPARPLPPGAPPLVPTTAYRWAILGLSLALMVVTLVAVLGNRIERYRLRSDAEDLVRREFPEASRVPPERVRAVVKVIVRARLADRLGPVLPAIFAVFAVLTLGAGGLLVNRGPGRVALDIGGLTLAGPVVFAADVGTIVIVLSAVGLAGGALVASRSGGIRAIGVLWEVANFWPRAAHPLAPPCYSERAVPELTRRIRHLTADGNGVVLSGQSHGSVLAAATVLNLPPSCRRRVALLTYGSPLARLYGRLFPAYVSEDVLREVGDRLDWRWINLWRDTDPIGGPIFGAGARNPGDPAGGVDRRIRDPEGLEIPSHDTVPPPVDGHRFKPGSSFGAVVRELIDRLEPPAAG
ncbi:hypothetical protein ACTMSW_14680 [Micromonospora sp. BQ11]|uniref:hypothetical protein n=1 Tax=Micromonospora sp. BQ11 TaxID=3452212 RepID=UPI003F8A1942